MICDKCCYQSLIARAEKAEAEVELLRQKNESYKQVLCARTACVKNCNECEYEAEAKRDE